MANFASQIMTKKKALEDELNNLSLDFTVNNTTFEVSPGPDNARIQELKKMITESDRMMSKLSGPLSDALGDAQAIQDKVMSYKTAFADPCGMSDLFDGLPDMNFDFSSITNLADFSALEALIDDVNSLVAGLNIDSYIDGMKDYAKEMSGFNDIMKELKELEKLVDLSALEDLVDFDALTGLLPDGICPGLVDKFTADQKTKLVGMVNTYKNQGMGAVNDLRAQANNALKVNISLPTL